MKGLEIGPMSLTARTLCALAGLLTAGLVVTPNAARAHCDVPDNGVPEDSLLSALGSGWAGLGGLRPGLAKGGVSVSQAATARAYAPLTVPADQGDERVSFRGVRKKIAENMHRSRQTAAHFT